MKLPSELVRGHVLRMFAKAIQDYAIDPRDLIILFCLSLAVAGERAPVAVIHTITGIAPAEILASIKILKKDGLIDQLGDRYPITKRGRAALQHVEAD
jgi:predicted transcriptional regulator